MIRKFLFIASILGFVLALDGNSSLIYNRELNNNQLKFDYSFKYSDFSPKTSYYGVDDVCVKALNEQIQMELFASLNYMNMAAYFNNPNIGHFGVGKFFQKASVEEHEHAQKIIDYLNKRGEFVSTISVKPSIKSTYNSLLESLETALSLETEVDKHLHLVHHKAEVECHDSHLTDFIEEEFFDEQIEAIHQLKGFISKLRRMKDGVGEYLIDEEIGKSVK